MATGCFDGLYYSGTVLAKPFYKKNKELDKTKQQEFLHRKQFFVFLRFNTWRSKMVNVLKQTLVSAAVAGALGMASVGAMAQTAVFPDFRVNEGAILGALPNTVNADKITGNYVEVITFNGPTTGGTFNVSLRWNAGQFVSNDGTTPVNSQLGGTTGNQYGLYALYQGNGTFTGNGTQTTFNFTPGGSLRLFTDPNSDTTFTAPTNGSNPFTTGNAGDDTLIATGVPTSGQGRLDPTLSTCGTTGGSGINCGSFGTSSSFAVNAAGSAYFASPTPFYSLSFQSGQLNNFTPVGTQTINGSLDVIFGANAVPEPASVALIGLGLAGLVLSRRRKQA
jgi:hypothetical protein